MIGFVGLTVIAVIVLELTVIGAVAVTLLLLDFAVMVVFPRATAVANPELSMVAILLDDDNQVTCDVTSPLVLLPNVAVAENCCVFPGLTHAPVGEMESAVMVSEDGKNPPQLASKRAVKNAVLAVKKMCRRILIIPPISAHKRPFHLTQVPNIGFIQIQGNVP